MKAVQVGILAALLVCAGLLYTVYRHQQAPAAPPDQPTAAATTPQPATVPPAESAAPSQEGAPAAEAPPVVPAPRKPSPLRADRKKHSREEMAEDRMPEPISPTPAAQTASAYVADTPVPAPSSSFRRCEFTTHSSGRARRAEAAPSRDDSRGDYNHVRLAEALSSKKNQPGDVFSGTLDQPLVVDGFAIAERGARVQGKLADVQQAGHVKGASQLVLQLTKVHTSDGQDIAISTEKFSKEASTSHSEDAKKVGIGAVLGTAIGAIAGGGKGAAIGAGAGAAAGGGAAVATRGKPVELPVETRLTFRLQQPVTITERLQ